MRIVDKDDSICVFILESNIDGINLNDYMKNLVLKLKRRYEKNISGFYVAHVYSNKLGIFVEFVKEDDFDFLGDMIDLKVIMHDDDVFLVFDDYFLLSGNNVYFVDNKYYVNVKDISYDNYLKICEFCSFVFGDDLKNIKYKMKRVLC